MTTKRKVKLFKDSPKGVQLQAGTWRNNPVWHSDDGGKMWWCGTFFSHEAKVTRMELIEMARTILQDTLVLEPIPEINSRSVQRRRAIQKRRQTIHPPRNRDNIGDGYHC